MKEDPVKDRVEREMLQVGFLRSCPHTHIPELKKNIPATQTAF